MNEFYKTILNAKGRFGIWGIVVMVLLGIGLIVFPEIFLSKNNSIQPSVGTTENTNTTNSSLSGLENNISLQIEKILSQIEGAGPVAVSITLEAGPEQNYAQDVTDDKSTVEEKDANGGTRTTTTINHKNEVVFAQGGGVPLLINEKGPKIKGVLVVAEGASDVRIQEKLICAVQALLNMPAHHIMVLPKESR